MAFVSTPYTDRILQFWEQETGNFFINSVAGSGKTTIIVKLANTIPERERRSALFLAFGREIQRELKGRLPQGMDCSTIHAMGLRIIRHSLALQGDADDYVDMQKYNKLARLWMQQNNLDPDILHPDYEENQLELLRDAIIDMVHYTMVSLTDPRDPAALQATAQHFCVDIDDWTDVIFQAIPQILAWGQEGVIVSGEPKPLYGLKDCCSGDDMVYQPNVMPGMKPRWCYNTIFVDEAQDLSAAQRGIVKMLGYQTAQGERHCRSIFVGDLRQAIFGFAGADCDSVENIITEFNCTLLPMNVCWRCPKTHILHAQSLVPELEAAPEAIEGEMWSVPADRVIDLVLPGDLVLCRVNAPLVALCYEMLNADIPAILRGRNIGAGLQRICKDLEKRKGFAFDTLLEHLQKYQEVRLKNLERKQGKEREIEALNDRCETLSSFYLRVRERGITSIPDMIAELDRMFSDKDDTQKVICSTVHRAKGLQAARVWIARDDLMPHPMARGEWQIVQERNIKYVAYTRAMQVLFKIREYTGGPIHSLLDPTVLHPLSANADPVPVPPPPATVAPALSAADSRRRHLYADALALGAAADECRESDPEMAHTIYLQAYRDAHLAAESLATDREAEPLRSLLYFTAALFALDAEDPGAAFICVCRALEGHPPDERRRELLQLQCDLRPDPFACIAQSGQTALTLD